MKKRIGMEGWIDVNKEAPPENTPILIAFKEYGRELNKYRVREAVKRGVFYFRPDFDDKQSNEMFYEPDFWQRLPACQSSFNFNKKNN